MGLILLLVLLILLIGAMPTWRYSRDWGRRPVSILGLVLVILLLLLLFERIPWGWGF